MYLSSIPRPPRIADDEDFANLKSLIDEHTDWVLELDKSNTQVWTRTIIGCEFNMVKILSNFEDCSPDVLFDVLHDPDYRKEWDSHMLESEEIGVINVNNDVGYYAMSCPPPLKPRDFVLMRSWLDTGPRGEQMLLSRSVPHKNYPPRKGYVRAQSHITGFIIRSLPEGGCFLGYVAHCDPQGHLPPWLVNKVTHTLGPRMVRDLRKAALGYVTWKSNQAHGKKPWRFPEHMTAPRISLEEHCIEPFNINSTGTTSTHNPLTPVTVTSSQICINTGAGQTENNNKTPKSNAKENLLKKKKKLFGNKT